MSFPFNQLPPELRLEIWSLAMQVDARRRRVVEQSFHVFPTLDLVASPLFAVNAESREAARAFYPVRLEVYRRPPPGSEPPPQYGEDTAAQQLARDDDDYRGCVYLSPALDDLVSVFNRATLYDSELALERSERSKRTAWRHRTCPMSEETRCLFRRHPDRWCLTRYASARLGAQDWLELHEWIRAFGEDEYRGALRLLRPMHFNTGGFAQVFGWG